ncbi:four-carbon acid sugar kinase family protein [Pseudomonas oryzihabitans]|uniref:four-carbon acid sugar kinase family protein n=1 Tax=Pseudomonas oryzihabitans TaxID=47885 RepID=UPI001F527B8C|nr:four-carbon acid sugar kinase family protein [Pseudomonas oryzihabitans]MCI1009991.1 four-carbon acid sugar kinase family protein [Pseudomonas oryzihabitans]
MTRLLILADDLSGAADCALGFAKAQATRVLLDAEALDAQAPVTALDLDSRRLDARAAAARHAALLGHPALAGAALYKKVDSTLRGNVAAEVAALTPRGLALVAPAYPALGRTTQSGIQYLDGVPVDQTDVWRNEDLTGNADLVAQLADHGISCARLDLAILRQPVALAAALRRALDSGLPALVCDAERQSDLEALARASAPFAQKVFWVGSAGLAEALPVALGLVGTATPHPRAEGPVLTVVGSMSRHSQTQAEYLAAGSQQQWQRLAPSWLLEPQRATERTALAATLAQRLARGEDVLVSLDQQARDPRQALALSQALAELLQPALQEAAALMATGGETARALLAQAGITALDLHGALAPGVALASTRWHGRALRVVTKAGGFGQPDTLLDAWRHLRASLPAQAATASLQKEAHHV